MEDRPDCVTGPLIRIIPRAAPPYLRFANEQSGQRAHRRAFFSQPSAVSADGNGQPSTTPWLSLCARIRETLLFPGHNNNPAPRGCVCARCNEEKNSWTSVFLSLLLPFSFFLSFSSFFLLLVVHSGRRNYSSGIKRRGLYLDSTRAKREGGRTRERGFL